MMMIDQSLIAKLPQFLTWAAGTDLLQTACKINVHWSFDQLRSWSMFAGTDQFDVVRSLPKPNQQRLLLAPRAFHLLQSSAEPGSEEIEKLGRFIRMEQYLCHQLDEHPGDGWSALGDYYLPATPETRARLDDDPAAAWSLERPFKAPTIRHFVLDAYSPYPNTQYPAEIGELATHTIEELALLKSRLEQSLRYIQAICRVAGSTIDASVQVFAPARSPNTPEATASVSQRSMIGKVDLLNLHLDKWTMHKISNALVHEAIHSMIYKLELVCSLYTDEEGAQQIKTVSLWTGKPLFVHSFVHACFVWFGLWKFWSLADDQDPGVRHYKEKARRGYLEGSPLKSLSQEAYECIQPEVRLAIEEMSRLSGLAGGGVPGGS